MSAVSSPPRRKPGIRAPWVLTVIGMSLIGPPLGSGQDVTGARPLLVREHQLQSVLPPDTYLLVEAQNIEQFLDMLDGSPPHWAILYGRGHHDPDLDERLFNLNRDRDAKREGNPALKRRLTFVWSGELSGYDPVTDSFRVALGPRVTPTRWGIVRFKPEDLPANLMAIPDSQTREQLRRRTKQGEHVEINVALTGTLTPEESLVYDFSHDEEGRGVIMPVVRIEQVDFVLVK